jgi:plastocyanin
VSRVAASLVIVGAILLTSCADDSPGAAQADRPASTAVESTVPPMTSDGTAVSSPASDSSSPASESSVPAGEPAPEAAMVQSIDNSFRPPRLEIAAGTEVVWVNRGRHPHDIRSDFGFGVVADDFQPGDEYRYVFTEPGEYPYYCTIHGTETVGMIGTVVVGG